MALIETWLKSDLGSPVQVKYLNGNMFSQDNQANLIGVRVYEDGEPADLTGTVSANVIRADGGTVAVAGTRQNGNECYVILPQAAYAVPGAISVIIKLTSGSQVTTLAAVISTVYTSSTDTAVDPGTILPSIQTLIAAIDAAVASIPADYSDLWASIAPNYSIIGFPVYTGYLCTYDGHLYRAKGDIPTSEAWNSSHWAQVNMGDYLHETKSAFNHSLSVAGENLLSISDFDTPTDSNVTFSVSGGKITITNGSSANYAGLLTSSTFLAKLVKGRMYRFHARCSIDSGDAAPIIAAKAGNNYVNAIYIGVSASTVADFVVDNNTSAIALMVAFGSSTSGSVVSFDELWVKEMGQDAVARADISDVKSALDTKLSLSDYTAVTQGSSFNDYTNIGRYGSASNAIAQTITDGPKQTMTGFLLVVETKDSAIIQTVVDNNNITYKRKYNNSTSTWTSWVTYALTSDIPNIDNTLSVSGAAAGAKATGDIKNTIKSYTGVKNLAINADVEEGYYYTNAGVKTANANFANCVITEGIKTGKRIWVTSEIHNTSANLGFVTCLDSNNDPLAYATSTGVFYKTLTNSGIVYVTQIMTVPTGTVKICVNRLSTNYALTNNIEQYIYAGFEGAYCKESALYPNGSIHINGVPSDILVGPSSDILNNIGKNVNVRNKLVCAPGMYIKYNTGAITSKDSFKMYFPIPTEYISAIKFTGTYASSVGHKGAFLDANLDFISGFSVDVERTSFPTGTKYVVLNDVVDSTTDFNILITFTNTFGSDEQNPYRGLNGVAFGTSLTARGGTGSGDSNYGYLDYLPALSEMTWVNDGVSSSTIVGSAASTILNHILNYADFATKQVVIIEGFVNDWATDIDVGSYTDTADTTVCGCLHLAIDHIKQINGNISIFVLLDHVGQSTCAPTVLHNNKTQYEFYEECKKCAEFHSVKVIREYAESDISVYSDQYLYDQIHLNAKGSQQSAQFIWSEMRRFYPNVE